MRKTVAKQLKILSRISGRDYRQLKRTWNEMPRNTPSPPQYTTILLPNAQGDFSPRRVKVMGRSLSAVRGAIALALSHAALQQMGAEA